ncbi:PD-(D/E)XK motif protein [Brasilonema bromeliae]|uniref:PD-(D/E)XK motif protein n=1 Tax=Brasilonema bromeliae SPC951 TaxID=385972 RepID=A0ABX1PAV2_9CYAN|nr:PD-(D/E)XK motif protein [Brasilonema bromeliae]NMG20917.1 hypothetical protein [Brasilonema bromeliae SPC951]
MSIRELWTELEKSIKLGGSEYLVRRVRPDCACDLRIGVQEPTGNRMLLLKIRRSSASSIVDFPSSEGFEVRRILLPSDGENYVTLQLVLTQNRYADIFTSLVDDVIEGVAGKQKEKAALEEFIIRLRRWQSFFKQHSPDGLSKTQQQGLYGELWFLRQVIIPQLGSRQSIQYWTGPRGTQQDFQFPNCAVEVKTTVEKQHQKLSISSERQLDGTGTGTLILVHLSLDVRQGRGESLPDIVNSVRILVQNDPIAKEELETLLLEVGYLDIHTPRYEEIGYTQREVNYFKVEGDFPRIVEADLPNGVGDVRYSISVAECKRFSLPELDVISLIGCNYE